MTEEQKNGDKTKGVTKDSGRNSAGKPEQKKGGRRRFSRKTREPKEFEESILQVRRVTRVTKGGRQLRFSVSVVIGDQKGRVGFGNGKSSEVMTGVQKAISIAKRNLVTVPIFEDSIPHEVVSKFKSSQVYLFPAPEGKGVIAGSSVRKILELAGIKNVLSKIHGSRNKINAAYATIEALKNLQNRAPKKNKEEVKPEVKDEATVASKKEEKPTATKSTKKIATKKD